MKLNTLFSALAGAASLAAAAGALAQTAAPLVDTRFSGHFFFGDSLSDDGNLFLATGGTQPPSPPYNRRFTNDLVFAEYLVPGLLPAANPASTGRNLDFAFGGATAAPAANPPSFAGQIALFNQRQITIGANELVSVLFGANDFFNAVAIPANQNPTTITNLAGTSVTNVAAGVTTLIGRGGRNFIVFALPDISLTPAFNTSPAKPLAAIYTDAYNSGIRTALATILTTAPAGTNITVADSKALLTRIVANPTNFGLTNVTTSFLPAGTGTVTSFLFFDTVHPTSTVQKIEAQWVNELLNPESVLATAAGRARATLATMDLIADGTITRLDTLRSNSVIRDSVAASSTVDPKSGAKTTVAGYGPKPHFDLYATYSYLDADRVGDGGSFSTRFTTNLGTVGGDITLACGLTAGASANFAQTRGTLAGASFRFDTQAVTAYLGYRPGPFFFDLSFGGGNIDMNKISRNTVLAINGVVAQGSTTGSTLNGHARVGYEFKLAPGFVVGPVIGFRYLHTNLRGYTESNAAGLEFQYGNQNVDSYQGTFGAFAHYQGKIGRMDTALRLSATYKKDFRDGTRNVTGHLAGNTSNLTTLATYDGNGDSVDLGVGVTAMLTRRIGLHADYTGGIRTDDKFSSRVNASVSYSF